MFTGIITDKGSLLNRSESNDIIRFDIRTKYDLDTVEMGESIAINGVCLTVVGKDTENNALSFDIIPETLDKTSLGSRTVGETFNIERSLRVGDRISGHFVMGHVDTTIDVLEVIDRGDSKRIFFALPSDFTPYVKMKGSVALDGISLTVSSVEEGRFSVDLIPQTLEETTFGELKGGEKINLEVDMLARYVRD